MHSLPLFVPTYEPSPLCERWYPEGLCCRSKAAGFQIQGPHRPCRRQSWCCPPHGISLVWTARSKPTLGRSSNPHTRSHHKTAPDLHAVRSTPPLIHLQNLPFLLHLLLEQTIQQNGQFSACINFPSSLCKPTLPPGWDKSCGHHWIPGCHWSPDHWSLDCCSLAAAEFSVHCNTALPLPPILCVQGVSRYPLPTAWPLSFPGICSLCFTLSNDSLSSQTCLCPMLPSCLFMAYFLKFSIEPCILKSTHASFIIKLTKVKSGHSCASERCGHSFFLSLAPPSLRWASHTLQSLPLSSVSLPSP